MDEHIQAAFVVNEILIAMFKFNFIKDADDAKDESSEKVVVPESETVAQIVNKEDECIEIHPTQEQAECDYSAPDLVSTLNCMSFQNNQQVYHVPIEEVIDKIIDQSEDIGCAEKNHSDLIAGIYEGGAKVWECTESVAEYLTRLYETKKLVSEFQDANVLDLGCGAGILGILALQNGASSVHFQDYNNSVLQHITIPNVLVNVKSISKLRERCRFFSGDWSNYAKRTADQEKFDFILTSETIYNVQNYDKIINILKTKLKPHGICYLAAKLHYFGVGGSLRQFEQTLLAENKFNSESVFLCNENVGREILKITLKLNES